MWTDKLKILTGILFGLFILSGCSKSEPETSIEKVPSPPSLVSDAQNVHSVVSLNDEQAAELNIKTFKVTNDAVTFSIKAPGTVHPAPENISIISAPVSGRVVQIYAHEGESVSKNDPLVALESLEYANLLAEYLENQAEANYLAQQLERDRQLVEKEISPQRTLDRAEADYIRASTKLLAAKARLSALGITEEQFDAWENNESQPSARLTLYSPINGIVNQHLIDLGTSVSSNQTMLDVVNNEKVLVRGFVSPEDATLIKSGTDVTVTQRNENSSTGNSKHILAKVTTVNPALDETNRAIPVNIIIPTENGWPVIGQNVRTNYSISTDEAGVTIPLSAIQFEKDGATVFVLINPNTYEKRSIGINRVTEEIAVVHSGLRPGDVVAVSQIFSLKALEKFEEFAD